MNYELFSLISSIAIGLIMIGGLMYAIIDAQIRHNRGRRKRGTGIKLTGDETLAEQRGYYGD